MQKTIDMTEGRPMGLLLRFAVPLMLGSLCQILYTAADGAVVGRIVGVDAFASIGAANFLTLLVFEMILGLTQGFGVVFAQLFGRKDYAGLRRAVVTAILLSTGIGVILTAVGLACVKPVLLLMDTPTDILPLAQIYVRWMYSGIVITLANRLFSTLLLSLGNSKAPVMANVASSILLSLGGASIMAVVVALFGKELIGFLITGEPGDLQQIIQTGYEYLLILAFTVPLMFLLCLYRAGLQGMGGTLVPTLSGFVELGMRAVSVLALPEILGKWAVYFASPLGWLAAMLLLDISYHQMYRRQMRKQINS